ncbi:MAG: hypothetical protein U0Z53_22905 [Blastocatellia bacterium]
MITLVPGAYLRAEISAALFVGLLVLLTAVPDRLTHAQYCNPAMVSYLVRDENGSRLTEAALKSVREQLPESVGDARIFAGETSLAEGGRTFHRTESAEWVNGLRVPSLDFINNGNCAMRLGEVTLTYHDKKMRLIFNLAIARDEPDRRLVIDSLPFQEGTFALDLNGRAHDLNAVITAERWKKV